MGVEVTQVSKISIRDDAQTVGTLRSRQNVMLRPEVAGRVLALGFTDGNRVRAGQLLVQLDDTLQRAEVQQSLAQVSIASSNHKRCLLSHSHPPQQKNCVRTVAVLYRSKID